MTNNIPKIRFKGFTDAWEQRKLNYYLETSTEKNTKELFDKTDVFSVSGDFGIVNQIEFQGRSFAGASVANYGIVNTGDVVYTKSPLNSNPYGIIKTNKLKSGIVSTLYAVYHPKKNTFSNFVQTYFEQNARVNNYLHPLVNKGAKNDMKVSNDNALKGYVIFPKYDEQKRIYAFFERLDHLITLYQRKCEKLKNVKKSILEKMFPQQSETTPKIRFKGFSDKWKQEKITNVSKIFIGLVTTMTKYYTNAGTLLIRNSDIKDNYFMFDNNPIFLEKNFSDLNANRKHKLGDIITVHTGDVGTSSVITEKEVGSIGFATIVTRPNLNSINSYFLSTFFNSNIHKTFAISKSTGDGRSNYNLGDFCELLVPVTKIKEQEKISKLFKNINKLISLTEQKIEKLKNIKTALLEKMFV